MRPIQSICLAVPMLLLAACSGLLPHKQSAAIKMSVAPGWEIYQPTADYDYRYGASIIQNKDGSIDCWFASPGAQIEKDYYQWDWIRYRHSKDGGKTWTPEEVILTPTPNSRDRMSVCDPAVFKMGDWYYIGVTAVEDANANMNEIFIARSKKPNGPFEKWNGNGWGGDKPIPMIEFRSPVDAWGAGEPSFVVKGKTIFVYYTILSHDEKGTATQQTWVGKAASNREDWPSTFQTIGLGWDRLEGEDSVDVKYCDKEKKFIGICTAQRMGPQAHLLMRESLDGIHWGKPTMVKENVQTWCHNVGISGDALGHIDSTGTNYVIYSFSKTPGLNWGHWHTNMHPVVLSE